MRERVRADYRIFKGLQPIAANIVTGGSAKATAPRPAATSSSHGNGGNLYSLSHFCHTCAIVR